MEQQYGVITEQGDLGLGFANLNPADNKVYNEAVAKQQADKDKIVINESDKDKQ